MMVSSGRLYSPALPRRAVVATCSSAGGGRDGNVSVISCAGTGGGRDGNVSSALRCGACVSAWVRKTKEVSSPRPIVIQSEMAACCTLGELTVTVVTAWGCFSMDKDPSFQTSRACCLETLGSSLTTISLFGLRPIVITGLLIWTVFPARGPLRNLTELCTDGFLPVSIYLPS